MFNLDPEIQVIIPSDLTVILEYRDDSNDPIDISDTFIEYKFMDNTNHSYICRYDPINSTTINCVLLDPDPDDPDHRRYRLKLMFQNYNLTGRIYCQEHIKTYDQDYEDDAYDEYSCNYYPGIKFNEDGFCKC